MAEKQVPTLSEFFESHFKPMRLEAMQRDPKTMVSYEESVGWWKKLSGDPPMDQVTDLDATKFVLELAKQRGKSIGSKLKPSSIAKHVVSLNTIFKLAGPKSSSNRRGQNIITDVPYFEGPKVDKTPPRQNWSVPEVRAMYKAADKMERPKMPGIKVCDWWRALIVGGYYLGLRIFSLLHICFSMIKDGWLTVPGSISKGGKGSRHFVHPEAMKHFEKIRLAERDEILTHARWDNGKRCFYDYFRCLQAHAEIDKARRWGFHSLRKTHASVLSSLALDGVEAIKTASRSCSHADVDITTAHYVSEDVQDRLMAQAILRMPSPCTDVVVERVEVKSMTRIVARAFSSELEFID